MDKNKAAKDSQEKIELGNIKYEENQLEQFPDKDQMSAKFD